MDTDAISFQPGRGGKRRKTSFLVPVLKKKPHPSALSDKRPAVRTSRIMKSPG